MQIMYPTPSSVLIYMQTFLPRFAFALPRPKLHVVDTGTRHSMSGIRATIYGATGWTGLPIGAALGRIGSELIFPQCHEYQFDDDVKELKVCQSPGQNLVIPDMNFDNKDMIAWTMQNSNVVVNLLGPRKNLKKRSDFEYINIEAPRRIAEACAKNPGVIRMIHFSAAGAHPQAQSLDLQTKYLGEQAVLDAFPNATIIRPSVIVGDNDYFVYHWLVQKRYLYNFNIVPDDCKAKRQPIYVNDVALAVVNALKMPETIGQTYELGGPHVYSLLECYELMHNVVQRPPKLAYVNKNTLLKIAQHIPNWTYFNTDAILKHGDDMVVQKGAKTIEDLYIRPVSFVRVLENVFNDVKARYPYQNSLYEN